jgi:hypothetical protein
VQATVYVDTQVPTPNPNPTGGQYLQPPSAGVAMPASNAQQNGQYAAAPMQPMQMTMEQQQQQQQMMMQAQQQQVRAGETRAGCSMHREQTDRCARADRSMRPSRLIDAPEQTDRCAARSPSRAD